MKYRVTKCPGSLNDRVFYVIGEMDEPEVGKEMNLDAESGYGLNTSEVISIETRSGGRYHMSGLQVVKTINSTYIVEKL